MSIKQLRDFIDKTNIAENVDEKTLTAIGERVMRQFKQDEESMQDWVNTVKAGLKLMKQEFQAELGESNYKDPLLTEASIAFGDKATLELLRSKNLVSSETIGKDKENIKREKGKRVTEFMNYQINHDMNQWRRTQSRSFYCLPSIGTYFKKTVFDPKTQKAESHIIQYPDFVVNQATRNINSCRSFSHILPDVSKNTVDERVRTGRWLDIDLYPKIKEADQRGDEGSNEQKEVIDSIDNPEKFIEQQTFFDLDKNGYEEPYIITVHASTQKVVRIVARFDQKSIMVEFNKAILPLDEALEKQQVQETNAFGGKETINLVGLPSPGEDLSKLKFMSINPFQSITKYGFFPAPDGTFLDLGYFHYLGAITQAINSTTDQLNNAGTLRNLGGGFLAKEFRKMLGEVRLAPGKYIHTDVPAEKLAKGIFPNPSPEPSAVLFQLNEKMTSRGKEFLALADVSGRINAQTAPTTALAIIQEAMIPTSALFKRVLDAQSDEFQVLFRLNRQTLKDLKYQQILDQPEASVEQDFSDQNIDIIPTANAEMSSKMHRIQTAQLEVEKFPLVLQSGGNPLPIAKNYFESIGSTITDQVFPEEGTMSPEEKQKVEQLQKAQDLSNQIQQQQLEILSREQDRLDADTQAKIAKVTKEIQRMNTEMLEKFTSALLNAEKAESEQVKNQIDLYTANLQGQLDILTATGVENDRRNISASSALTQQPNINRGVS